MAEQNRAQLAEIENLKTHSRTLEDRADPQRGASWPLSQERAGLEQQAIGKATSASATGCTSSSRAWPSDAAACRPTSGQQLAELSQRYPSLQFDPETGISKLDTDILFDSGEAVLKPGAEQLLDELVHVLKSPAAGDLKIMVAGHTDNQSVAGKAVREKYPNNFHLSTARALAVADRMKRAGLPEQRLGVAGFGPASRSPPTPPPKTARRTAAWRFS